MIFRQVSSDNNNLKQCCKGKIKSVTLSPKLTCCSGSKWLNRLHKGDWYIAQAHIPQDYVDAENKWHGEYPFPAILRVNCYQRFYLHNLDCHISSNRRAYEVDTRHCKRKLEIQFLFHQNQENKTILTFAHIMSAHLRVNQENTILGLVCHLTFFLIELQRARSHLKW